MSRRAVLPRQVVESRVIAIVRGGGERHLMPTCRTLVDAGIGAIEITTNAAGWGLGLLPGVLSPTEIIRVWRAGATAAEVFPVVSVGGASYVRRERSP